MKRYRIIWHPSVEQKLADHFGGGYPTWIDESMVSVHTGHLEINYYGRWSLVPLCHVVCMDRV